MPAHPARWSPRWCLAAAALTATACQLIGGIGDIEPFPLDAAARDVTPGHKDARARQVADARKNDAGSRRPDATVRMDASLADAETSTDGGDAGRVEPGGTPCAYDGACYPSGATVGAGYCSDGGIVSCGQGGSSRCCPGNANGKGTSGDFCANPAAYTCSAGQCAPCGGQGDFCCAVAGGTSGVCTESNNVCADGICRTCGQAGDPCCIAMQGNQWCTQPGSACGPQGKCVTCECMGGECCDGNMNCVAQGSPCSNGHMCQGSSCDQSVMGPPPCGVAGEACCSGGACFDGSPCIAAMCVACGSMGDACCVDAEGKKACAVGLACDNLGKTCDACGGATQVCCPGDICSVGTCNPTTNLCDVGLACGDGCGGVGETCCGTGTCAPGLCCNSTSPGTPLCLGQGDLCANGYVCDGNDCVCGGEGQPCCPTGAACDNDGGECTDGTCS